MAKFDITVDTDSDNKSMTVTMNGQKIENVSDFSAYHDVSEDGNTERVSISVYTQEKLEDNTYKRVSYHSYGSEKANMASRSGLDLDTSVEGFIGVGSDFDLFEDIKKYLLCFKEK